MKHLDKTKKNTISYKMTHFEIQRKTHVGLLVVVHRLDKKNEITKVITHCKTGKKQSSSPALIAPIQNKTKKE